MFFLNYPCNRSGIVKPVSRLAVATENKLGVETKVSFEYVLKYLVLCGLARKPKLTVGSVGNASYTELAGVSAAVCYVYVKQGILHGLFI